MKILFINPNPYLNNINYDKLSHFFRNMHFSYTAITPPLVFPILSACTPDNHEIYMIDEGYQKIDFNSKFDLIGITSNTVQAVRTYQIADEFRKRRMPVIIGGCHATALPKEVKQHADSVVIGEAEEIWPEILRDLQNDKLKSFYRQKNATNMNDLPNPDMRIISKPSWVKFDQCYVTQSSRGCPNRCKYCYIGNSLHNNIYRRRPIEKVVSEIEKANQKTVLFYDPSFTADINHAKKLCIALKPLNKRLIFEGNVDILSENYELLKVAKEAGCVGWVIGFESVSQKSMDKMLKNNNVKKYYDLIEKIHDYGMSVHGLFMFGFDNYDKNTFKNTLDFIRKAEIDSTEFSILTPLPGTPLFDEMMRQKRILTRDWSKYGYEDVVFKLKNFTEREFFSDLKTFYKSYYSYTEICRRFIKTIKRRGVINFDFVTFIAQNFFRRYITLKKIEDR